MRARTFHTDHGFITHDLPMKSHPSSGYVPDSPKFDYGTGIHGAYNIITESCDIRDGRAAHAHARASGHNSMREFLLGIQAAERGEGFYTLRTSRPTFKGELFVDELANAGALEGADKHDDWGFEGTQLPQFKMGYTPKVVTSSYVAGDQYSQLGTTLRACVLQPAPFKGSRRPSFDERLMA